MYKMYDKAAAIREIQIYLQKIGASNSYIAPSGIYDETTREAVINFQSEKGLSQNGIVDKTVFDLLYEEYVKTAKIENINDISEQNVFYPFNLNDYGEHIRKFNSELIFILDYFGAFHKLRNSSIYSSSTEEAVHMAEKIFGMPRGVADEIFHSRLKQEIESIKNYQKSKGF